mmetsp:Transcript_12817/g.23044  ORF Transcript_12817/g.23044 Transcript_12817/m.23044 type:complete len:80 (+) Transcript_12817:578-817(+)
MLNDIVQFLISYMEHTLKTLHIQRNPEEPIKVWLSIHEPIELRVSQFEPMKYCKNTKVKYDWRSKTWSILISAQSVSSK